MKAVQQLVTIFLVLIVIVITGGCNAPVSQPKPENVNAVDSSRPTGTQPAEPVEKRTAERFAYGSSGLDNPLYAWRIADPRRKADKGTILCVFEIHGFEDAFYKDGAILVRTGEKVVSYFKEHPEELEGFTLLVVPSANPDGLDKGFTCNGPGRCQISEGYDINMGFDYRFAVKNNDRNRSGSKPLSSPEGKALYDLVVQERPEVIIDFHGWICSVAGDNQIAQIFADELELRHTAPEEIIFSGFFSGWAMSVSRAVLVEYPDPFTGHGSWDGKSDQKYESDRDYADHTIMAIRRLCQEI